ncbi:PDDEXK family nuclease [Nocardia stercoris]|uniref:Uma2 family endonuclease n=1 Tax=Nocardia stercoris TaxID=2483361 RepID=UPI00131A00C1|nr:Uma2 family endonuclease [Nocardia stercoris]
MRLDAMVEMAGRWPEGHSLQAVAEVWSAENTAGERETKMAAYAAAGIRYLWTCEVFGSDVPVVFQAYRLRESGYRVEVYAADGETVIAPGPAPVHVVTSRLRWS